MPATVRSMALPRLLLRVIDPAQVYFDRHRRGLEARERFAHRQAAVFGPEVVGGSRAATSAERVELAAEKVRYRDDYEAAITDAKRRWAPQLERAAAELLTTGATRIRLGGRTVDARIITFWRGDHILRTATRGPNGDGETLSRISRDPRRLGADVVVEYLARAATKG